jgi:hypothetical protein
MTGGNSGLTVLTADWTAAMAALEPMLWDVFAPVGLVDTTIQASIFAWIKDLRNNGNKVFLIIGSATGEVLATAKTNAATFNHEGVAYVWPGVTQDKAYKVGTVLSGANFVGRIAGLIASKGTEKSLTFATLTGVTALEKTPTNSEVKSGLTAGLLMLTSDGAGTFRVEYGINTLTTLSGTQSRQFKKIRIIRILDLVFNTLTQNLTQQYLGDIENDQDGQKTVMAAVLSFLSSMSASRYLRPDYTVEVDTGQPVIGDSLFLKIGVKPVDSVDFIYLSINVG